MRPGSGKIWTNTLTKPAVPKITGLYQQFDQNESIITYKESAIKSLQRPISAELATYKSIKKRNIIYKREKEL